MKRTAVINVVGLTGALIGEHTPRIRDFAAGRAIVPIIPAFPAVTCTAQSNFLTGRAPSAHGIVGNGWYHRELAEVQFWKQSDHLVSGRKLWGELREAEPKFTCAKLFWWFNMYSSADYSITPRPMYPADGRKVFDIYTQPYSIRSEIKKELGEFPFPSFWGPAAGVDSPQGKADAVSRWIAGSARWVESRFEPTLSLIYLPHLDYNLQRYGTYSSPGRELNPAILPDLRAMDGIVGDLIDFFAARDVQVVLLSEYGITNVDRPVHLNRLFREQGWLAVKEELGLEILDCGASKAFAVADHQVAHVYINDSSVAARVRSLLENTNGIASVLDAQSKSAAGIDHSRAGDLIAVAQENAWFSYYYWLDDRMAPDFARTVDIHRKPGYDPMELFLDPAIPLVKLRIAWRLLQKRLGFRMLMDVIPLDSSLVRGSHGCKPGNVSDFPILIAPPQGLRPGAAIQSTDVYGVLKRSIAGKPSP